MDSTQRYKSISPDVVQKLVDEYDNVVPPKLTKLDEFRYDDIPALLAQRKADGDAHLNLSDITTLVDWKLSHGTFRPSLKKLVSQNTDEFVQGTTRAAFADEPSETNIKTLLAELCKLRGIGPATASLLLSVSSPETVPFFSDELFRWVFWEDKRQAGWDRTIKYTPKEYLELYTMILQLQQRLEAEGNTYCSAIDLEKAAYVLGKRASGERASSPKSGEEVKPTTGRKHGRTEEQAASTRKAARRVGDSEKPKRNEGNRIAEADGRNSTRSTRARAQKTN